MKKVLITFLMLLLPVCDVGAYQVYLNNGSVISGVRSYDESGDEVYLYIGTGSLTIPKADILKIEGSEASEEKIKEGQGVQPELKRGSQEAPTPAPVEVTTPAPTVEEMNARMNELKTSLNSVNSEIRSAEQEEARLNAAINEKKAAPSSYDSGERRRLEEELASLTQRLNAILEKKTDLMNQRSSIENELRTLGR